MNKEFVLKNLSHLSVEEIVDAIFKSIISLKEAKDFKSEGV